MKSAGAAGACLCLFACASGPDPAPARAGDPARLGARPEHVPELSGEPGFVSTYLDARPAALVDGRVVSWGDLKPLLSEAAGGPVLREVILDHLLVPEAEAAGITIHPDDVDAERTLFYEMLNSDPDVAVRLARELRARQGLGSMRFERLLRRNAMLRALVRDEVTVSEAAVERAYEVVHGAKRQARLIVVPTLAAAQEAVRRIRDGEPFAEVAVTASTDVSASRGGLLEPISRADPSYPRVLRDALWNLAPGELSAPVLLSDQYAVVQLVRETPGDGVPMEEARPALERRVRLRQERLLMDQLARRLLDGAAITIFDDRIKESWDFQSRLDSAPAAR